MALAATNDLRVMRCNVVTGGSYDTTNAMAAQQNTV
jgi:hypothetical protein